MQTVAHPLVILIYVHTCSLPLSLSITHLHINSYIFTFAHSFIRGLSHVMKSLLAHAITFISTRRFPGILWIVACIFPKQTVVCIRVVVLLITVFLWFFSYHNFLFRAQVRLRGNHDLFLYVRVKVPIFNSNFIPFVLVDALVQWAFSSPFAKRGNCPERESGKGYMNSK